MSAAMIDAEAARFLEKRECGNWSAEDETTLQAWLDQSSAHCAAFWRLEAVWGETERLSVLRPFRPVSAAPRSAWPIFRRIAAACVLLAGIGAAGMALYLQPEGERYATAIGGRQVITLADGSQVELNTDTVVRIAHGERRAWVDKGEAFFRIAHDDAHPFIVTVAGHRVVDLGTEFSVHEKQGRLEVTLIEGRARVESADETAGIAPVELVPGEMAVATAQKISVSKKGEKQLASELSWRRGVLIFDYTSLAEAAAEFNRYNQIKLVLSDKDIAKLTMVGTFPINDVALFGRVAERILNVKAEKTGNRIVISR